MSTQFETADGETVFSRTFTKAHGKTVCMEFTQSEWPTWCNEMVSGDDGSEPRTAQAWFDEVSKDRHVVWMTAADFNEMARECENHRFADEMPAFAFWAAEFRARARRAVKDSMRVV